MLNVLDVSRYIINYSNKKGYNISNLRLQKLLYFVQAYYLCTSNEHEPCFSESIIAWDFGPVVLEAYHEFKCYGGGSIPSVKSYYEYNSMESWPIKRIDFDEKVIPITDRQKIVTVIDYFSKHSTMSLVKITHNQTPWKAAYEKGKNKKITQEAIKEFFTKNE